MYVAVTVGSIQGKSRFTVAEGQSRNSTVALLECWYLIRIVLKSRWDISWFKNPQRLVRLLNQPKFVSHIESYVFVIQKSNHHTDIFFIIFIDDLTQLHEVLVVRF